MCSGYIYNSTLKKQGKPCLTTFTEKCISDKDDYIFKSFNNSHKLWNLLTTSRFFVIRSNCNENLAISIKHSEWATTYSNQAKLDLSFRDTPNVILIFSANRTFHFQGFSRMTTQVSDKISKHWQSSDNFNKRLGGCFGVEWIRLCDLPFTKTDNLKNLLADISNQNVKCSRDTSELSQECGIKLCLLCDNEKQYTLNNCSTPRFKEPNQNG